MKSTWLILLAVGLLFTSCQIGDPFHVANVDIDSTYGPELESPIMGTQVIFRTGRYLGDETVASAKIHIGSKLEVTAEKALQEPEPDRQFEWITYDPCDVLPQGRTLVRYEMLSEDGRVLQEDQIFITINTTCQGVYKTRGTQFAPHGFLSFSLQLGKRLQ